MAEPRSEARDREVEVPDVTEHVEPDPPHPRRRGAAGNRPQCPQHLALRVA